MPPIRTKLPKIAEIAQACHLDDDLGLTSEAKTSAPREWSHLFLAGHSCCQDLRKRNRSYDLGLGLSGVIFARSCAGNPWQRVGVSRETCLATAG